MRVIGSIVILGAMIVLVGIGFVYGRTFFYVTDSFRYRLTVNFLVDGHPLSASGVVQETFHQPPCFLLEEHCGRTSVNGEAFPVKFPNGAVVFVLLGILEGPSASTFPSVEIPNPPPGAKMIAQVNKVFPVRKLLVPTLVHFSDPNDPYSARAVGLDEINSVAGGQVSFKNATIMVTGDDVTRGIVEFLPWAKSFKSNINIRTDNFRRYLFMQNLPLFLERNDW